MSLRQEILNEIKAMLKEVEDGQPLPPEQQSTSECPAGMIKAGSGSNDGTKPICRYPTEQEKAGMEMGKKAGKFIGDMTDKARQGIQQGIQGGLDWLKGYQSKGICPPGMEQTGGGPSGPLCSPKDTGGTTKRKTSVAPRADVKQLQQLLNRWFATSPKNKSQVKQLAPTKTSDMGEDGVYGADTKEGLKMVWRAEGITTPLARYSIAQLIKKMQEILATQPSGPDISPKGPGRGASGAGAPVPFEESKNWATKTREKSSTSLFERLVKDAAKSKVL